MVATLALVPGLLSDSRVWLPLSESVGKKMPVYHAALAGYDSLPQWLNTFWERYRVPLSLLDTQWAAACVWRWQDLIPSVLSD